MKLEGNEKASEIFFLCIFFCFYLLFKKTRFQVFFFSLSFLLFCVNTRRFTLQMNFSCEHPAWGLQCEHTKDEGRAKKRKHELKLKWKQKFKLFFFLHNTQYNKKKRNKIGSKTKSIWCKERELSNQVFNNKILKILKRENWKTEKFIFTIKVLFTFVGTFSRLCNVLCVHLVGGWLCCEPSPPIGLDYFTNFNVNYC